MLSAYANLCSLSHESITDPCEYYVMYQHILIYANYLKTTSQFLMNTILSSYPDLCSLI